MCLSPLPPVSVVEHLLFHPFSMMADVEIGFCFLGTLLSGGKLFSGEGSCVSNLLRVLQIALFKSWMTIC